MLKYNVLITCLAVGMAVSSFGDDSFKDQDRAAAIAFNYCTVSLTKMSFRKDVFTCQMEMDNVINNLNLMKISDEEIKDAFVDVMSLSQEIIINQKDIEFINMRYDLTVKANIYKSFPTSIALHLPESFLKTIGKLQSMGGMYANYSSKVLVPELEHEKELWELEKNFLEDIKYARVEFINAAYDVFKKRKIPDSYRLTETQIERFLEDSALENADVRYKRLDMNKGLFEAYPPFWYFFGKTAMELGMEEDALDNFEKFSLIHEGILRKDPFTVGVSMGRVSILLNKNLSDESKNQIKQDLKIIEVNSSLLDWNINIFCALAYEQLGLEDEAYRILNKNKAYYGELSEAAVEASGRAEIMVAVKGENLEKLKEILDEAHIKRAQSYLYLFTAYDDEKNLNIFLKSNLITLERKLYWGTSINAWAKNAFVSHIPASWISEDTTLSLQIDGVDFEMDKKRYVKSSDQYRITIPLRAEVDEYSIVEASLNDPSGNTVITYSPVFKDVSKKGLSFKGGFKITSKKEIKLSHYSILDIQFNAKNFKYDKKAETFYVDGI